MKLLRLITASLCLILGFYQLPVEAATPRAEWVSGEISHYNNPLAAQLPQEVATKMERMAVSPFVFYRGTAHIFYQDMQRLSGSKFVNNATSCVWLDGDMHLQNLGAFRDAKDNDVFDTNDFDEGYCGEYVWDLRRMAVSILLAAKENGIDASRRSKLVLNFVDSYLNALEDFKGNDSEKTYRLTVNNTNGVIKDIIQAVAGKSRSKLLGKYTVDVNGKRQFKDASDLISIPISTYSVIENSISNYILSIAPSKRYSNSFYSLKDISQKLKSGVGSLGRYRYYLLIEGPTSSLQDDVILEMKEQITSSVAIASPNRMPLSYYGDREGQRVAMTMKAMLNNPDKLLGYVTVNDKSFLIREKTAYEEDLDYRKLDSYSKFKDAVDYFGKIVAKNHALADRDYDPKFIPYSIEKEITEIVAGGKSAFKDELLNFSLDYATQVELDYNSFFDAIERINFYDQSSLP